MPNPRQFGPQDEDDLLDQKQYLELEKLLPIVNGLLYDNDPNCRRVISDKNSLTTLFGIYNLQFPIQMHENALYSCLNLVSGASNQEKQKIVE